jgi:hypothetical protein
MLTTEISLQEYENAERVIAQQHARPGLFIHALITVLVSIALVVINIAVASEFPWSPFPVVGMGIGLFMHYWFGYRHLDAELARKQREIELQAAALH